MSQARSGTSSYVSCKGNDVAHFLTGLAFSIFNVLVFHDCVPIMLRSFVCVD